MSIRGGSHWRELAMFIAIPAILLKKKTCCDPSEEKTLGCSILFLYWIPKRSGQWHEFSWQYYMMTFLCMGGGYIAHSLTVTEVGLLIWRWRSAVCLLGKMTRDLLLFAGSIRSWMDQATQVQLDYYWLFDYTQLICKQFGIQKVHTSSLFIDYFDDIAIFDVKSKCIIHVLFFFF